MDFLKKLLGGLFAAPKREYVFSVRCARCGEIIEGRVDLSNDLSVEYQDGGDVYRVRKVLIGQNRCFQRVEAELKFNEKRELIEKQIAGGEFVATRSA